MPRSGLGRNLHARCLIWLENQRAHLFAFLCGGFPSAPALSLPCAQAFSTLALEACIHASSLGLKVCAAVRD